jgi:hypothetical protein
LQRNDGKMVLWRQNSFVCVSTPLQERT